MKNYYITVNGDRFKGKFPPASEEPISFVLHSGRFRFTPVVAKATVYFYTDVRDTVMHILDLSSKKSKHFEEQLLENLIISAKRYYHIRFVVADPITVSINTLEKYGFHQGIDGDYFIDLQPSGLININPFLKNLLTNNTGISREVK